MADANDDFQAMIFNDDNLVNLAGEKSVFVFYNTKNDVLSISVSC